MKLVISVIGLTIALVVKFVVFSPSNQQFATNSYGVVEDSKPLSGEIDSKINEIEKLLVEMGFFRSETEEQKRRLPQIGQRKDWGEMSPGEQVRDLMTPNANISETKSRLPQIREPKTSVLKMQSTF